MPTLATDPEKPAATASMVGRLVELIDRVPSLRQSAKEALLNAQKKITESMGDSTENLFELDDLVLYYDKAKESSHSNKLAPKWKGPYCVIKILPKGAYRIADNNGPLKNPVNGNFLKLYKGRLDWQPIVVIN